MMTDSNPSGQKYYKHGLQNIHDKNAYNDYGGFNDAFAITSFINILGEQSMRLSQDNNYGRREAKVY
jgi:hypothetical protein